MCEIRATYMHVIEDATTVHEQIDEIIYHNMHAHVKMGHKVDRY